MKSLTLNVVLLLSFFALFYLGSSFVYDVILLGMYTTVGAVLFALFYFFSVSACLYVMFISIKKLKELSKAYEYGHSESGVELENRGDHLWD